MSTAAAVGDNLFRLGSQGYIVREVQLALRAIGYQLKGTGYFGPATLTAVKAFQGRAGLKVDGVVGRKTAHAIDVARGRSTAAIEDKPIVTSLAATPATEIARPLWLEAGIQLIGTKESPGSANNPTIIDWAQDEGGAVARDYTHDSIPWCALFQNHIFSKVGLEGTETLWALDWNADRMQSRLNRRWPGVRLRGVAVGAVAPMLRNGGGHVITVVGKDQYGNVMGLGGNQSDTVSIVPFPVGRLNEGFWWPEDVPTPDAPGMASLPLVESNGRVSTREA